MESSKVMKDVKKTIVKNGTNEPLKFNDGSKITFHFQTCMLNDNGEPLDCVDDSKKIGRPMEIILGKQFKMPVWEKCLEAMKLGEISKFTVPKSLVDAYPLVSKSYREFAGISKGLKKGHCCGMMTFTEGVGHQDLDVLVREPMDLQFTLELLKVEPVGEYKKEPWTMNAHEKRQIIPELKEIGNQLYKKQLYEEASKKYAEALGLVEQLLLREKPGDPEWLDLEKLKIPILSNYAQCKLLQKDYYSVIEFTTTILEKDKNNVKALFRRGKAYVGTWDLDLAENDFMKVAELDPSSKAVVQKELKNMSMLQKEKDKEIKTKLYGKVFGDKNLS
ncbi:AH receptor-interacting protein [Trichonephila inaurata madagascariensis]|uniref:peptidylprolyl isomerase n=1 Tax=Trichonephila inaurata madagascariensis TaxID=2747483 RepID=A0A8X6YU36_9ARAC|nr:AH receptor-interacting protein [Trichonephila inaurata madagascariensis]